MIVDDKSSNENCEAGGMRGKTITRASKLLPKAAEKISVGRSVAEVEGDRGTTMRIGIFLPSFLFETES